MPAIDDGRRIMAMGLIQFMTSDAARRAKGLFGRNTVRAIENPGVDSRPVRACRDRRGRAGSTPIAGRMSPDSIMPGSMLAPRPVLRIGWFGFLRTRKQALGRADAENDADDCADHEIQQSGIEHSLKGITHLQRLPSPGQVRPDAGTFRRVRGSDHATDAGGCRTADRTKNLLVDRFHETNQ
jgi:hypothetical protein